MEIAIDYLQSKGGESPLEYSFGMSEAARAKFASTESLTDRLKVRGQWTGTCSDFVQLGVEDLDAHTIVSLMIISAGDEKRQIRERIFSTDKNVVGVAIGPYKQSTAVAVTLSTKFVANGPTDELEASTRGYVAPAAEQHEAAQRNYSEATLSSIDAMREASKPAHEDFNATDEELEQRKREHIARLEAQRVAPNARVVAGDEDDPGMAEIQRDRLAALQAMERGNAYSHQTRFEEPTPDSDEPPPHLQAQDANMESYEEAEARKRAFFEEQERQKREAIVKAEETRKNAWKIERQQREEQKKQEEAERLRRLQEGNMGPRPKAAAGGFTKSSQTLAQHVPPKAAPVNSAAGPLRSPRPEVVASDSPEQDELQKERMAKIAALEQNNPYATSSSTSGMEDNTNVVGGLGEPAAYDPTRESYEEAEARKRAWFADQERQKREAMIKAEELKKNAWKAERAAREEAKKREEAERLARLQAESNPRKLGGGGYSAAPTPSPAAAAPALRTQTSQGPVVRQTPVQTTSYVPATSHSSAGDDDGKDAVSKEEERMMRTLAKKQGGAQFFGKVDAQAAKEEEMKKRAAEAKQREEQVARLREEKWKQETLEAERRAAARAAEAEAKARALASGALDPSAVLGSNSAAAATYDPVATIGGAAARAPPEKGNVEDAIAELGSCSEEHPVTLYLNALVRDEESMKITSLAEVRDGVSFWSRSGHKVSREGKYAVGVAASPNDVRLVRIPARDLVNDDFNALSDYFFFGTAEYLTLYPSADLNEAEVMHVSDLTTLSPGERYYLASGNVVEIIGGANPQFLINGGEKEVALPEEIMEQLRY